MKKKTKSFSKTIALSLTSLTLYGVAFGLASMTLLGNNEAANNHVVAGSLNIDFELVDYRGINPNEQGVLEEFIKIDKANEGSYVNLIEEQSSVFEIENAVPTLKHTATFKLTNNGTTAFDYSLKITDLVAEGDASVALSEQISITIWTDTYEALSFNLNEFDKAENVAKLGHLTTKDSVSYIYVSAEFLEGEDNNKAQNGIVEFDIQLDAIQKVN